MDVAKEIISYLGCECEIIKSAEDVSVIMDKYENLLLRGKAEGFTPLIIVPSDMLCEIIEMESAHRDHNSHRDTMIERGIKTIKVQEFLNNRIQEGMPIGEDNEYDIMGEFVDYEPVECFNSLIDYAARRPYDTIIIGKIPTNKPWELAAWIPMGGWNECPAPEEQVAVFKHWYEKYGAIPAVVHGDIWELYVEKHPNTKDEAVKLAWEQFGFCGDIIWQGVEKINVLASTLVNSKIWYFWWD